MLGVGTILRAKPVARAEAVCGAVVVVEVEPVVETEILAGASTACGAAAPAVFGRKNPNALTGAAVSVSFPPNLAVAFSSTLDATAPVAPGLAGPAPLPLGCVPAVAPVTGCAGTWPPADWLKLAGNSWLAPGRAAPAPPILPCVATSARPSGQTSTHESPTKHIHGTNTFCGASVSDMASLLKIGDYNWSGPQNAPKAGPKGQREWLVSLSAPARNRRPPEVKADGLRHIY